MGWRAQDALDGLLFAGNENVIEEGGARWAPIGRYDMGTKTWESFRLRLVSEVAHAGGRRQQPPRNGLAGRA